MKNGLHVQNAQDFSQGNIFKDADDVMTSTVENVHGIMGGGASAPM